MQLRRNGFSYDSYRDQPLSVVRKDTSSDQFDETARFERRMHRVDITLVNCNENPEIVATGKSTAYSNYFTAGTTSAGVTNVHEYQRVMYKSIYENIDLEFLAFSNDSVQFKYNFIVHPGGNINDIQLRYEGSDDIKLISGKIEIAVESGILSESIPFSYYKLSGERIEINYELTGANTFGFTCNEVVDEKEELVIDPGPCLSWGTYFGGPAHDRGWALGIDSINNLYLTGETYSTTNIATAGSYQSTNAGSYDVFIAKLDSSGTTRLWCTYYGGTGVDQAYAIVLDSMNNIYITGITTSTGNIASVGAYQTAFGTGLQDAFIAKFSSLGFLLWGTYYGSGASVYGRGIAMDRLGNVCVGGYTDCDINIATPGAYRATRTGSLDGFFVKFSSTGTRIWGTYFGGSGPEYINGIALDTNGNIFYTGYTGSLSGIATPGAFQTTNAAGADAILGEINSSGTTLVWGTYYGGTDMDEGYAITLDDSLNVYVTGRSHSPNVMGTPGSHDPTDNLGGDIFVAKFTSTGARMWGTYYGGIYIEYGYAIAVDEDHDVYIAGWTTSPGGIATVGAHRSTQLGSYDACVAKFYRTGSQLLWGSYYGGANLNVAHGIQLGINNKVYIAGWTNSVSQVATIGAYQTSPGGPGTDDAFVAKFGCTCTAPPQPGTITGPTVICEGSTNTYSISVSPNVSYYIWSLPNGWTGSSNSDSIYATAGALSDSVFVWSHNSCGTSLPRYINVTVNPLPIVSAATSSDSVCPGGLATLSANGFGGVLFIWNPGNLNGSSVNVNPTIPTSYTVTVTSAQNCSDTSSVVINMTLPPTVSITGDTAICFGDTTVLSASGATSFLWNPGNNTGATNIVTPGSSTTYTITGTDAPGCTDTTTFTLGVDSLPLVVLNLSAIDTTCLSSGNVVLIGGAPSGGAYSGSFVSGGQFDAATSGAGTFNIVYTYTDSNGCVASSIDSIYVDLCLEIDNDVTSSKLIVSPVPVVDVLNIISPNYGQLAIYNNLGVLVYAAPVTRNNFQLDMATYPAGLYYLVLDLDTGTQAVRIIKT